MKQYEIGIFYDELETVENFLTKNNLKWENIGWMVDRYLIQFYARNDNYLIQLGIEIGIKRIQK